MTSYSKRKPDSSTQIIMCRSHKTSSQRTPVCREDTEFPEAKLLVSENVPGCTGLRGKLSAMSAIPRVTPVPLHPNMLLKRAWQNLHADFKVPIGGSFYFHIVIDQYSKYPAVDIVCSTSFKKLKPKLDCIFSAHSIPAYQHTISES